jgi:outer membrane protein OmpA-like peptidoglycan-associated protein
MSRRLPAFILCGGLVVLTSACATKGFVREQVGTTETRLSQRVDTTETKLGQRVDTTETKLRETTDRTAANSQAIDATGQRLQGVDTRVGEVASLAGEAKKDAAAVAQAQRDAEMQVAQRFASRNKYAAIESKSIYFEFAKAELSDAGINELQDVANALKADPNAVVELQGFADARGSERYNFQLTRERVDAVVRYLVQRHGIDLRRIYAVGMGKVAPAAGDKAGKDAFAKSRRVDLRLLAPQS